MAQHNDTGQAGEELAAQFLEQQGFQILHRNWRFGRAEVDIVAMDGPALVLVEVKARSSDHFGRPEDFVSAKKQRFLAEAASRYMEMYGHDWEIRFDVVAVLFNPETEITHFRDAFFPEWG
ncbi:MAG TPA: YraN family protein [Saprospiraceae bacterium]|jgi:putative endonuclease|nr:YraN family protein [Saprospiraceae bacterium]HRF41579.1 YraN family protein [Saprospiraceae bacterium]HRK80393.1 YraN family protein [Saprospiraceae bacterium]